MIKKIIKSIGLMSLIIFSFFYSEKVITVIKEQDPIMIKLLEVEKDYIVESVNATIMDDTIIPGIKGSALDINKSYNSMKKLGMFNSNYIVLKDIIPMVSIVNNYDKYIVSGNTKYNNIAIIFKINNDKYLDKIINLAKKRKIVLNLFIDYTYMNNNLSDIYTLSLNNEIYNYGENGEYKKEYLILGNNIINRVTNNKSLYCYTEEKSKTTIDLCIENKMHTIMPKVIKNNLYNEIKNNINNGDIITIEINASNIDELDSTINFIIQKGLDIVGLSKLLQE